MIDQIHKLDVIPGGTTVVIHVKQYQTDESLRFELYSRMGDFEIDANFTDCTVRGTKSDGNGYSATAECIAATKEITVQLTEQMTAVAGIQPYEITVTDSTGRMITATFLLYVHRAALDADTMKSESMIREVESVVQEYLEDGTADSIIDSAIDDWLDNHPEATTTVPDGSLTEVKFTDSLKLQAIKDYVTPQMYGAKADGTTDDTAAIQAAIDSGEYVVFPKGTYKTTQPITIYSKTAWSMDAENADIVYTGNDFAFKFRALRYSYIRFGMITADNGGCLFFDGSAYGYWSQYDNFWFKVFRAGATSACIKAVQDAADGCWINEMRWHAGRLMRGQYGVHLVRSTPGNNMSHWDFHEIGIEGDSNNVLGTGFKFESDNDGKIIGSFLFDNCRHEEGFTTLIETTGPVTKMNFITQASFPYNKISVDSGATDWKIYCPLYDSLRIIDGKISRVDRMYSLDGGILLESSQTDPLNLQNTANPLPVGNYYCDVTSVVLTMVNCPTGKQFQLKVEDRGGSSTHASARYRYLGYTLTDFDNIEYICTASSSDGGVSWSFSGWIVKGSAWIDISSQISWDSSKITSGSFAAYYHPTSNEVVLCGNATVSLTAGSNVIGTLPDAYKAKMYYTTIKGAWNGDLINGVINARTSIRLYPSAAYSGNLILEGRYLVY